MTHFLTVGDVFELKKGMKIYGEIPEKFRFMNRPFSNALTKGEIVIGEIRQNNLEDWNKKKKEAIEEIGDIFENAFGSLPEKEIQAFVEAHIQKPKQEHFDTSVFAGEYVVISTSLTGGGVDSYHQNHSYADGHLVFCKKLENGAYQEEAPLISFYQSGSFTAVISDIQPIRQMKMLFV